MILSLGTLFLLKNIDIGDIINRKTIIKTDTVYKTTYLRDTFKLSKPIPKLILRDKIIRDTFKTVDSIPVEVDVPIDRKEYEGEVITDDSNRVHYEAFVSGYKASLDSVRLLTNIRQKETIITKIKVEKKRFYIAPSIGVGYGLVNGRADVFVGISAGVSF